MAGSGGFTVEKQAMANGATAVSDASAAIAGILTRLNSEVETMLGGWQNASSRSLQEVHALWTEQQNNLKQALDQMRQALDTTGTAYEGTDQEQSDALNQLKNNLI